MATGTRVSVGVNVRVAVDVGEGVSVGVRVGVRVGVGLGVSDRVGVSVRVEVGVRVTVTVAVRVGVIVRVSVGVRVWVANKPITGSSGLRPPIHENPIHPNTTTASTNPQQAISTRANKMINSLFVLFLPTGALLIGAGRTSSIMGSISCSDFPVTGQNCAASG